MIKLLWHKWSGLMISYYRLKSLFYSEKNNLKARNLSEIIQHYHVIEKGLSMPDRRYCFGEKKMLELCTLIIDYIKDYGIDSNQLLYAASAILEYKQLHEEANYNLNSNLKEMMDSVLDLFKDLEAEGQPQMSRSEFFSASSEDFYKFSHGRHSCRHFCGEVNLEDIEKAIKLAQETTPSACNRQSVCVHLVNNKDILHSLLEIQSGNRGFGHTFDKLIVITSDMSYWNYITYIGGYVDGGIYLMNLLYSLYYYQIGACPLNTFFNKKEDKKVRKLLNLSEAESIVGFIGVGNVTDNVILAKSGRKDFNEILNII